MKITVFYDYICPYCYLGSKRLEKLEKEFELEFEWIGIEIHPEFSPKGVRRSKTAKSRIFKENIYAMAKEDGVELKLPGFATNSRLCLEASEFAKKKGVFNSFHNNVYKAYFLEGRNIGDFKEIIEIGENSGFIKAGLEECLEQRSMFDKIEDNKKTAEDKQIFGVPSLIINGFPLFGNQSLDTLRHIIKRSMERSN